MNKAPPYSLADIVDLDANRLPKQVWRNELQIGPAFRTEAEALTEDTRRHTAQVFIHDVDGNALLNWWEVSQSGLPERLGHTEQKALLRMRLRRGRVRCISRQCSGAGQSAGRSPRRSSPAGAALIPRSAPPI